MCDIARFFPAMSPKPLAAELVFGHFALAFGHLALVLCFVQEARGQDRPAAPADPPATVDVIEQATQAAIRKAERSVVAIARVRKDRVATSQLDPLFGQFSVHDGATPSFDNPPHFFGTGVVISSDGYIVTCGHVLDDPRRNDYHVWINRQHYSAEVAGVSARVMASDAFSDLAVLKIEAQGMVPITFGDAAGLRKGQFVIALGNPDAIARDGVASASWGMVSNLKRYAPTRDADDAPSLQTIHTLGTLIQADVRLPLGTSGGALVDLDGKMVGLTTSLAAVEGTADSAGFAIAVDAMFERAVDSLKQGRLPEYGFLGIQPGDLRPAAKQSGHTGAIVAAVMDGMPGQKAGLNADDIIVQVNDQRIENRNDLFRELSMAGADQDVILLVERLGKPGVSRPVRAHLSKKSEVTPELSYAVNAPQPWRGLTLDYLTALPPELLLGTSYSSRHVRPAMAVMDVQPGTSAWLAGIRPGDGVVSVDGLPLESPQHFRELVQAKPGPVRVGIVHSTGHRDTLSVLADSSREL